MNVSFIDKKSLAKALGISQSTINRALKVRNPAFRFVRIGPRRILFPVDIIAELKAAAAESVAQGGSQ